MYCRITTRIQESVRRLVRDQSGITGLETAIVLIAFVVVAAVFAFTVLTTGLFTSEKAKETAMAGVSSAGGSLELVGSVIAGGNNIGQNCRTVTPAAGPPAQYTLHLRMKTHQDAIWIGTWCRQQSTLTYKP